MRRRLEGVSQVQRGATDKATYRGSDHSLQPRVAEGRDSSCLLGSSRMLVGWDWRPSFAAQCLCVKLVYNEWQTLFDSGNKVYICFFACCDVLRTSTACPLEHCCSFAIAVMADVTLPMVAFLPHGIYIDVTLRRHSGRIVFVVIITIPDVEQDP